MNYDPQSKLACVLGGVILLGLAAVGFYVALMPGRVGGGIPFIPDSWNQHLGHIVFGLGACVTAVMGLFAFYQALAPRKKE